MNEIIETILYINELNECAKYNNIEFDALKEFVSVFGKYKYVYINQKYYEPKERLTLQTDYSLCVISDKLGEKIYQKRLYENEIKFLENIAELFEGE